MWLLAVLSLASPERLVEEASAASPEVAQAKAAVDADRARVPQAGALPDPSLSLGIQNDGFTRIAIGEMETSYFSIGLTQPLYWPGKRGLRGDVASIDVRRAEARLTRALLDVEARTRRAWIGLLLVRGQRHLLDEQQQLWTQAEATARARYESGQAPQSDLLRAQLEKARIEQQRWSLEAEEANRLAELNRVRGKPLDEPVETPKLVELPVQTLSQLPESPELQLAELGVQGAEKRTELARREKLPDFAVSAAVMPRGSFEPMWSLGVSVGLPIWGRQQRAVDESAERAIGEAQGAEALRQIVRLREEQRKAALAALQRVNEHYRTQLLILSEAAARSTLAQYEVGRVPFATVLEALAGYVNDRAAQLASLGEAQLLVVAQREASLEPVPSLGASFGSASMSSSSAATQAATSTDSQPAAAAPTARAMGGM